jgi:ornithine decarboxylase
MSEKIFRFLAETRPETPCLVVDLDVVADNFRRLRAALPQARIYYAVKANPAPEIIALLNRLGASFDTASIYEVEHCLKIGARPDALSFGSTIKKQAHIARAYALGVRLFAFDSEAELDKLAAAAPGARVYCRFLMSGAGADWPLSEKFGCEPALAVRLLERARDKGLVPHGVSFHVGSQQRDLGQWDIALEIAAGVFRDLAAKGIELNMVNLGGGFPARYRSQVPAVGEYGTAIMQGTTRHFGNHPPTLIAEPGRYLPGDAGVIQAEVVLIAKKRIGDTRRWIYLDIGKFGGLAEVMGEAIQYRIRTPYNGGPTGPVVLAGPTCDEVDVLYDKAGYELPLDLKVGDKVEILSAGAYTTTYCSVGFNGFPPLKEYYI